jgi:hypothetical protein
MPFSCGSLEDQQILDESIYFDLKTDPATDEIFNHIRVPSIALLKDTVLKEVFNSSDSYIVGSSGNIIIDLEWNDKPIVISSAIITLTVVSGNPTIDYYYVYACNGKIQVSGNIGSKFTILVEAKTYINNGISFSISQNDASILEYGQISYEFDENHLIQSDLIAQRVADNLINSYSGIRNDAEIEYPGNIMLELGDPVLLTEYKDNSLDVQNYFYIVRQSLQYTGSLDVNASLRRII